MGLYQEREGAPKAPSPSENGLELVLGLCALIACCCRLQSYGTLTVSILKMNQGIGESHTADYLPRVRGTYLVILIYSTYYKAASHYVALAILKFTG